MITEKHLEFCESQAQVDAVKAFLETGSNNKAAKLLGKQRRGVDQMLQRVKHRAAEKGYAPEANLDYTTPIHLKVKGTSELIDMQTGEAKLKWVKTDQDKELLDQMMAQMLEGFSEAVTAYKPLKKVKAPKTCNKDTLTVYPMGDPHIGMYSWAEETGSDFDCDLAEKQLKQAMAYLVDKAPPSEEALILNLGDFFHSDNQSNRTARAGNSLDVDTRWARVIQIGIELMIECVHLALEKHKTVRVKNNIGNHDDHTSQVLSICMAHAFKNNPRVIIEAPQEAFYCHVFGKNMIISTHGHMVKPNKMHGVITNYYPEEWGKTEHRYCYLGHFHHEDRKEENGLIVEIFNTLAAQDAWHHASGYKSKRNMKALVLDKEHGEIERYTFSITR